VPALPLSYGTLGMPLEIEPAPDAVSSTFTAEKQIHLASCPAYRRASALRWRSTRRQARQRTAVLKKYPPTFSLVGNPGKWEMNDLDPQPISLADAQRIWTLQKQPLSPDDQALPAQAAEWQMWVSHGIRLKPSKPAAVNNSKPSKRLRNVAAVI